MNIYKAVDMPKKKLALSHDPSRIAWVTGVRRVDIHSPYISA